MSETPQETPDSTPGDYAPAGPDTAREPGHTPATEVEESDPSADSRHGLAGGMGVSSERPGVVRGVDEQVTYGVAETHPETPDPEEAPPEQSAFDGRPETHPDSPGAHESDPDGNPGRGI